MTARRRRNVAMNEHYTPPLAEVADVDPLRPPPPRRLLLAVRLLWASIALGIPTFVMEVARSPGTIATVVGTGVELLVLLFVAYLNVCIWRTRNWARIVVLLLIAIEVVALAFVATPAEQTPIEIVCNWIAAALDVAAVYLLFTPPVSTLFKKPRRSARADKTIGASDV